jgi:hypothetical protein
VWLLALYARRGKPAHFLWRPCYSGIVGASQPVFMLPFWIVFALLVQPKMTCEPSRWLCLLPAGISAHLYLPLRRWHFLNDWGHPAPGSDLLNHRRGNTAPDSTRRRLWGTGARHCWG